MKDNIQTYSCFYGATTLTGVLTGRFVICNHKQHHGQPYRYTKQKQLITHLSNEIVHNSIKLLPSKKTDDSLLFGVPILCYWSFCLHFGISTCMKTYLRCPTYDDLCFNSSRNIVPNLQLSNYLCDFIAESKYLNKSVCSR